MVTLPPRIAAFIEEVQREGAVWAIHGADGIPVFRRATGEGASPFWSNETSALLFSATDDAGRGMDPIRISWKIFRDRWIPGLLTDGLLIDVNPQVGMASCDIAPDALEALMRTVSGAWQPTASLPSLPNSRAA